MISTKIESTNKQMTWKESWKQVKHSGCGRFIQDTPCLSCREMMECDQAWIMYKLIHMILGSTMTYDTFARDYLDITFTCKKFERKE